MKRKIISIILALTLSIGLAVPALASNQYAEHGVLDIEIVDGVATLSMPRGTPAAEITNAISVGLMTHWDEGDVMGFFVITSAPTTITTLRSIPEVWPFFGLDKIRQPDTGRTEWPIIDSLDVDHSIALASGGYTGERFDPLLDVGSTYILETGIYVTGLVDGAIVAIIVRDSGANELPSTRPITLPAPAPEIILPTEGINVLLDGTALTFDVPPQVIGGRTLVPLRAIFEALGAEVNWNEANQTVTATKDTTTVVLTIGSTSPTVNGQTVTIDVPASVIGGRTLVPLRFVAESLGVTVDWNANTSTVTITS